MTTERMNIPAKLVDYALGMPAPASAQDEVAFDWVETDRLCIDASYQRKISTKGEITIRKILRSFSWARFGAIVLAAREDGRFAIIDGQHRAIVALLMRIDRLPAMIVKPRGLAAEAMTFVDINDNRTSVGPVEKFRARVTAGEPDAVQLAETLEGLDISYDTAPGVPLKPRQTRAISMLQKLSRKHGRGTVFTALEMLVDGQPENPDALTSLNIDIVTTLTARVIERAGDIDRLARVVAEADLETISDNAGQLQKIKGGLKRTHAQELLTALYDRGLRAARMGDAA